MFCSISFVFLDVSSFFSFYFRFVLTAMSSRAVQGTEHPPLLLIIVQGAECPGTFRLTVVFGTVDIKSQIDRLPCIQTVMLTTSLNHSNIKVISTCHVLLTETGLAGAVLQTPL